MRVLVTGTEGFVGSHAAELLIAAGGVEVHGTVFLMDAIRNIAHINDSLHLHQADITNYERVEELVRTIQPDRILHIAGQAFVPTSLQDPMATFQANLFGGLNVLEAVRRAKQQTGKSIPVLVVGSGEVYGRIEQQQLPLTEETPLAPNTPYSASKASLDLIAQQYVQCFGVDAIIVRPFNHAGPRQSPSFVVSDFAKQFAEIKLRKQEPVIHVGNISVHRDFTDVRDVVRAYWRLFDRKTRDFIFNVASHREVEIRSILSTLSEISGVNPAIVSESNRVRAYDVPVIVASYDRLHQATGWKPQIEFRQTLEDTYQYWLDSLTPAT